MIDIMWSFFIVLDGPWTTELNVVHPVTLTEGDSIGHTTCTADCYPVCSINWVSDEDMNTTLASLPDVVYRNMSNTYTCVAENIVTGKTSNSSFHLIVQCKFTLLQT